MVLKRANAGTATAGSVIDEGAILALGNQADVGAWGGAAAKKNEQYVVAGQPSVLAAAHEVCMATQDDGICPQHRPLPQFRASRLQSRQEIGKVHAFSQQLCWACPLPAKPLTQ